MERECAVGKTIVMIRLFGLTVFVALAVSGGMIISSMTLS
jgi:hypothetical protein